MLPDQLVASVRHHWWLFLLRGLAAIAFGVLVLLSPGLTVVALTAFVAAYALVDGGVSVVSAFRLRPAFDRWWVLLIQGLISVAFGVLAFMNPALSLLYVVISISLWFVFAALAQFMLAKAQKAMGHSPTWAMVGAALSVALAAAVVVYPRVAIAGVVVLIAWFALAIGIAQVVVAFGVRGFVKSRMAGSAA
jgi:uncharacterized membrane protein HdeD (DUF308 family)